MFSVVKIISTLLLFEIIHAEVSTLSDNELSELKYLNTSADPCDDFYEFACGNFKNIHPRPSNAYVVDHFTLVAEELTNLAREILSSPNSNEDPEALKKVKAAYKACVNVDYSDTLINPEITLINDVGGFPMVTPAFIDQKVQFNIYDIADLVANYGVPLVFNVYNYPSTQDSTKNLIYIKNESLINLSLVKTEDMSYEEVIEESLKTMALNSSKTRADLLPFDIFLRNITRKLRSATGNHYTTDENIYDNIDEMSTFMRQLYFGGSLDDSIPEFESRSTISIAELQEWSNENYKGININWLKYFRSIFSKSGAVINETTELLVYNNMSSTLYGILNLIKQTDPAIVKNFALMRIFLYMAPDSDASTRQAFEEYYRAINNALYPRSEYCIRKLMDSDGTPGLSYALAYGYQRYYFDINKISKAVELIGDLEDAFVDLLNDNDWMDAESKAQALLKVQNMISLIAYPDLVENGTELDKFYENLRICSWDGYGNSYRIRAFKLANQLAPIDKPRDRTLWDKSPFIVNAYYNRANNRIIYPVSMLNAPFFTGNVSIMDYGHIGSIIGHEITHGFDSQGALYNADSVINGSWWTSETTQAFSQRISCFVNQYSQYYVEEVDSYVDGTRTLNENIADNGGTRVSLAALRKLYTRTPNLQRTDSYSREQLFFIGFATTWCYDPSVAYLNYMKTSDHSYNNWRVNGVLANMEEFSEAFQCPVGSSMNPENKCKLW